jgi:hypothetical protein
MHALPNAPKAGMHSGMHYFYCISQHLLSRKLSPASLPSILSASLSYARAASSSDSKLPMWRARLSSL